MPYPQPLPNAAFEHYPALQKSSRYLPMNDLDDGCIYLIHARNSYLGVWDASAKGFVIVREKLGQVFLFTEYHWDADPMLGTAKPFGKLSGPVQKEDRRKALDEAHAQVSYEHFMEVTRAYCG